MFRIHLSISVYLRVVFFPPAYSCVVLQDKRRDVDLLRSDAGEELLQVVQVADLLLHPRHTKGGEEPRRDLERAGEKIEEKEEMRKEHFISYSLNLIVLPRY